MQHILLFMNFLWLRNFILFLITYFLFRFEFRPQVTLTLTHCRGGSQGTKYSLVKYISKVMGPNYRAKTKLSNFKEYRMEIGSFFFCDDRSHNHAVFQFDSLINLSNFQLSGSKCIIAYTFKINVSISPIELTTLSRSDTDDFN